VLTHKRGGWELVLPPAAASVHRVLDDEEKTLVGIAGFMVDLDFFAREFLPDFAPGVLTSAVQDFLDDRQMTLTLLGESDRLIFDAAGRQSAPSSPSSSW